MQYASPCMLHVSAVTLSVPVAALMPPISGESPVCRPCRCCRQCIYTCTRVTAAPLRQLIQSEIEASRRLTFPSYSCMECMQESIRLESTVRAQSVGALQTGPRASRSFCPRTSRIPMCGCALALRSPPSPKYPHRSASTYRSVSSTHSFVLVSALSITRR